MSADFDRNIILYLAEDDCLYAIEVESGKRLWKFETDDTITGGVTLSRPG